MKLITINYLSHHRLNYVKLMFHFLSKIKKENKKLIKLNILATNQNDWDDKCKELEIDYEVHIIQGSFNNYLDKIKIATSSNTEFSVKLDEDCFINNNVWDFLIENI